MQKFQKILKSALILSLCLLFFGCKREKITASTKDLYYRQGMKFLMREDFSRAAENFENSFKRKQCYPALLKLAYIAEKQQNYEDQLYYSRLYLQYAPKDDPEYKTAVYLKEKGEEKLFASLKKKYKVSEPKKKKFGELTERERRLMEQLAFASKKNAELKNQLGSNDSAPSTSIKKPKEKPATSNKKVAKKANSPIPGKVYKTYKVEKGDNLYKVSKKNFGTIRHWRKIYELNRDKMKDEGSLKVGMELRLPDLPKSNK